MSSRSPRSKFVLLIVVCLVTIANPGGVELTPPPDAVAFKEPSLSPAPDLVDGLSRLTRIDGDQFLVQTVEGDLSFLPGVNLGSTIPGSNPQDLAITAEHYRIWFPQMAAAGFQAIRVAALQNPAFYQELAAHNEANQQDPLYLFHGIGLPDDVISSAADLLDPAVRREVDDAVDETIAAANGQGGARGGESYTADVGPWIAGWIVGSQLDPYVAVQTNELNPAASFRGRFFQSTSDASATEVFLAETMDRVARRQAEAGRVTPVAFNNSAATDPIVHRYEPVDENDMVQIDPNHVVPANGWDGGTFASYEADPYYPDFQRFEPEIVDFAHRGQTDPYAGYLSQLSEHHSTMPFVVSRFGVSSGQAVARSGPLGRNHGGFDEETQMAVNAGMMRTIADLGFSGGMLASWIDEWHLTSWNTAAVDIPARQRSMWMNAWAADAHFGVMAAEPGRRPPVVIDGIDDEWETNDSKVVLESDGSVRRVKATHDEGWLYLSITTSKEDWLSAGPFSLGFDVIDGAAGSLPTGQQERVADYALLFTDHELSLMVADHADVHRRLGLVQPDQSARASARATSRLPDAGSSDGDSSSTEGADAVDVDSRPVVGFADGTLEPGEVMSSAEVAEPADAAASLPTPSLPTPSPLAAPESSSSEMPRGLWHPHTLLVRSAYQHPTTGAKVPVETTVPGELTQGTTDRTDPMFDSRVSWQMSGDHLEVRVPWQGIGISDPSKRQAYRIDDDKLVTTTEVERILVTAASGGRLEALGEYSWEPWDQVTWHQVPKSGIELISDAADNTLQNGLREVPETTLEGSQ